MLNAGYINDGKRQIYNIWAEYFKMGYIILMECIMFGEYFERLILFNSLLELENK